MTPPLTLDELTSVGMSFLTTLKTVMKATRELVPVAAMIGPDREMVVTHLPFDCMEPDSPVLGKLADAAKGLEAQALLVASDAKGCALNDDAMDRVNADPEVAAIFAAARAEGCEAVAKAGFGRLHDRVALVVQSPFFALTITQEYTVDEQGQYGFVGKPRLANNTGTAIDEMVFKYHRDSRPATTVQ